jgi:hypothetical protein
MKRCDINRGKASKIFKQYEEVNLPGSGLVRLTEGMTLGSSLDLACVVCSLNDLIPSKISELKSSSRAIALRIEEEHLKSW